MDAPSTFKVAEEPGTPLRQLSCEQINQQRSNMALLPSPSLHSLGPGPDGVAVNRSPRQRDSISSIVQEKVAFLNSLSGGGGGGGGVGGTLARSSLRRDVMAVSPSKRDALERTICGYEESQKLIASANAEIEQLRSTIKGQAKQLAMTGGRIEKLMEQLANETQQNEEMRLKYVQEVKKVRKQCFQAEKVQLELQEEVKETKKELRKREAELAHAKQRKEEAKQEAFERAYAVAGVTEEMEILREKLKVMEQEKDAAVKELRNYAKRWAGRVEKEASSVSKRAHEMVRIASQSEQQQHPQHQQQHQYQYPYPYQQQQQPRQLEEKPERQFDSADAALISLAFRKRSTVDPAVHLCHQAVSTVKRPFFSHFVESKVMESKMDEEPFTLEDHIMELYREVAYYQRKTAEAKEIINMLCMQCQLHTCACRRAEKSGKRYIYDAGFDAKMQERLAKKRRLEEEDEKAQTLPPVPSVEQGVQVKDEAVLEEARQVPLPEMELDLREHEEGNSSLLESTPTATAALEEMTQVVVAPMTTTAAAANEADLKFTFSLSGAGSRSTKTHNERSVHLFPRAESALAIAEPDMFDLSPPKNHPPRPSTALGVSLSEMTSPIRLVAGSPATARTAKTTDRVKTSEWGSSSSSSSTRRVALRDAHGQTRPATQRRAHSRPPKPELFQQASSPLGAVIKTEVERGRSRTPDSPAANKTTMFGMTPKPAKPRSMHARSQTHDAVPLQTQTQSFTTTTTTTRVPLRSYEEDEEYGQSQSHAYSKAYSRSHGSSYSHSHSHSYSYSHSHSYSRAEDEREREGEREGRPRERESENEDMNRLAATPMINREAALAQIRARRDRARSVNIKTSAARSRSTNGAEGSSSNHHHHSSSSISSSGGGGGSTSVVNKSAPSSVKRVTASTAAMLREVSAASMMSAPPGRCG